MTADGLTPRWNATGDTLSLAITGGARRGQNYTVYLRINDQTIRTYAIPCIGNGTPGLQGCIIRMRGEWSADEYYLNQSQMADATDLRCIDVVSLTDRESEQQQYFQCKVTSDPNVNQRPIIVKPDGSQNPNTNYWEAANISKFIATDLLISKTALIELLQGSKFFCTQGKLADGSPNIVTGMQSVDNDQTPTIFAGAADNNASAAKFRVYPNGKMIAENAEIRGKVTATEGEFTGKVVATSGSFRGVVTTEANIIDPTNFDQKLWIHRGGIEHGWGADYDYDLFNGLIVRFDGDLQSVLNRHIETYEEPDRVYIELPTGNSWERYTKLQLLQLIGSTFVVINNSNADYIGVSTGTQSHAIVSGYYSAFTLQCEDNRMIWRSIIYGKTSDLNILQS